MGTRRVFVGTSIMLLSWICGPLPAMAQGVGAIGGTISDASGAVLPGATVTLSNPGTIGGNQEGITNERGAYQFVRLVPGRYSIRAELPGFRSAVQENVDVNADVTSRVDLKLEIGQVQEAITITAGAPLLDTTSALEQTVLPADLVQSLPNRTDMWSIVRVVPSISLSKVDIGGSEAFLQSNSTLHGTFNENAFMMDGMDVAAPVSVGTQTVLYPDPYIFQEINYQLGGGSAELSQGGIIFNQITKTGTNALHGGLTFAGANHSMDFSNVTPALRAQLLHAVPPQALAANPNINPESTINDIYDGGAWLGGPIVPNKLWFIGAAHTQALNRYVLGSYNTNGSQVVDDNLMWNASAKISWQMSQSSQLSYFYNLEYKLIRYRNDNVNMFVDSQARRLNAKYPSVNQVKWTKTLGSKMVWDASSSIFYTPCDCLQPEPGVAAGDVPSYDSVLNAITVAQPTYSMSKYFRGVILTSVSYNVGPHQLKLGYQYNEAFLGSNTYSIPGSPALPSGIQAVYRNGVPEEVHTFNTPVNFHNYSRDQAAYIQDRWTPIKKLTLNLGLRFESFDAWQPAGCQPQTAWVQAQCFPALSGVPDFKGVVPRLSAIYDIFGDGKTALKASFNRYEQPQGISLLSQINPLQVTSDTRLWTDTNGSPVPELNQLGPSTGFNFGSTNHFSPDLKWPVASELAVELQNELPGNMVVSARYTHRTMTNNIGATNLAVPLTSYIPIQVVEATSGRQVTVYNEAPALRGQFNVLYDNSPQLDTSFNGVDLSAQKRLGGGWMILGGASFGRNIGDVYCVAAYVSACPGVLNDPNYTFRRGLTLNDVPYSLRLSGLYQLPYSFSLSGTVQRSAGSPELTTVIVGPNSVALTRVTQSLAVQASGTTFLPALNSVDISLKRTWRIRTIAVEPRLDVFNLTNAVTILGRNTVLGPTYDYVNSIQGGRLIKLGANVAF